MKMLPTTLPLRRPLRRAVLSAAITALLPAFFPSSAWAVTNWSGTGISVTTTQPPDDIVVQANSTVTLTDGGGTPSITELSMRFAPLSGAGETLTVNGAGLTLRSLYTVLAPVSTRTVQISGTADFAPGELNTGANQGTPTVSNVLLTKFAGTGTLILDAEVNNLAGTRIRAFDGRISVFATAGSLNPLSTLTTAIEIGSTATQSAQVPILRFVGNGFANTTFGNSFAANFTGTIEHYGTTTDTLSNASGTNSANGIGATRTLTVNVVEGGLVIPGTISDPASTAAQGGNLRKLGAGTTLTLGGETNIKDLNVAEGTVVANGRLLATSLTFGSNTLLSLRNPSASVASSNNLPAVINITPGGTLEGLPGTFVTGAGATPSTLKLSGGALNLGLGGPAPGLSAHLYTGNWPAAQAAFTTFANFSAHFASRGPGVQGSTGANGLVDLSFAPGGGDTAMFSGIAPSFTATNDIVARFNGKIVITTAGTYTFGTTTDDGSMVYIDGQTVVANNFSQGATRRQGAISLAPGLHDIEIGYYEGVGANSMTVDYSGPDTSDGLVFVPNAVLLPKDSVTFLNPVIATENSTINTSAAAVTSTALSAAKTLTINGYKLDLGPVTLGVNGSGVPTPAAGAYTVNVNSQYGQAIARSVVDGGLAVSLTNNGPGMLILESGASPQLQNAGSSVNITNGELGVVLGGAGGSPTGNATVNVNGRSLVLSSKGGDQTYSPAGLSFTNGGSITAAAIGSGVAGSPVSPITVTLTNALTVNAGNILTISSQDNYRLRFSGVSGGNSLNIPRGLVESTGPVNLTGTGQLTVDRAAFTTLNGVSAKAISVSNGSLTNTGTLTSGSTLDITAATVTSSGAISSVGALTQNGGSLSSGGSISASSIDITAAAVTSTGAISSVGALTQNGGSLSSGGNISASSLQISTATVNGSGSISATGSVTLTDTTLTSATVFSAGTTMDLTNATVTSNGQLKAPTGLTATRSTIRANAGTQASNIALNDSTMVSTGTVTTGAGGIALESLATVSSLELRGGSITGGPIAAHGGIIHATSGVTTVAASASFTGNNPTGLTARFVTRGAQAGSIWPAQTQAGIFEIEHHTGVERILTTPLSFLPNQAADATISQYFGGVSTEPNQFAIGFFGNFTAPESGLYSMQLTQVDDDAGFWIDLDNDGVFETAGGNGNELIAQRNCCGDSAVGTVTLVAGQTYKIGIGVEDGQGGSSLVASLGVPSANGSLSVINPGDPSQAGYYSYGLPNQVVVDAGAELQIRSIDGSVNVIVNGDLDLRGAGSSTFDSLVIGDGGVVTLGGPALALAEPAALAVPEPGSIGLLMMSAAGFLSRRRRAKS